MLLCGLQILFSPLSDKCGQQVRKRSVISEDSIMMAFPGVCPFNVSIYTNIISDYSINNKDFYFLWSKHNLSNISIQSLHLLVLYFVITKSLQILVTDILYSSSDFSYKSYFTQYLLDIFFWFDCWKSLRNSMGIAMEYFEIFTWLLVELRIFFFIDLCTKTPSNNYLCFLSVTT